MFPGYEIVEFAKTVEQLKKLGVVKEPKRRNAPRLTIIENEVRKNIQGRGCLHPLHLIGHHVGRPLHLKTASLTM